MPRIFNSIRQRLLKENRLSRYLVYAIGEILLVVIGILIALQINNWNAQRVTDLRNGRNLVSLQEELGANEVTLTKNIELVKKHMSLTLNLMDTLNKQLVAPEDREEFLHRSQNGLGPLYTRSLSTTALAELVNSGGYSEIASSEIKRRVLIYQAALEDAENDLEIFRQYWHDIELPYLLKHYSLLDMWMQGQHVDLKKTAEHLGHTLPDFRVHGHYFNSDQTSFYDDRTFANLYTLRFFELTTVLGSMEKLEASMRALDEIINDSGR